MSNIRQYLADAQRAANESFSNADGFIDDVNFTGDDFFNNMGGMSGMGGMAGMADMMNGGSSQPATDLD